MLPVYEIEIKQGTVHIASESEKHARWQAEVLEYDLTRKWWVRQQVEFSPRVFALGSSAWRKLRALAA